MTMKTKLFANLVLFFSLLAGTALADTHTWTGLGGDGNWSTIANWYANYPPYNGEAAPVVLVFPAGAARLTNTCNIPNLNINSLVINGSNYTIYSAAPATPITLAGPGGGLYSAGTNNKVFLPFTLGSPILNFGISPDKELQVFSQLTGSGGFQKTGRGKLTLAGSTDNLFTGTLTVLGGKLHLQKSSGRLALSGPLVVGDTAGSTEPNGGADSVLVLDGDQQMPFSTPLTVNPDARFSMNGHSVAIGSLAMVGNGMIEDITGAKPTVTLLGDLSASPGGTDSFNPTITANLSLGGATRTFHVTQYLGIYGIISNGGASVGIVKTGGGTLTIYDPCSYTGNTVINEGIMHVYGSIANSSVTVNSPGTLAGSGATGPVSVQGATLNPVVYVPGNANPTINLRTQSVVLDASSAFAMSIDSLQTVPWPFLTVTGTVQLGGCKLNSILETTGNSGVNSAIGSKFTLIDNDGTDAISGTFAGLTEGALFKFGGRQWKISYLGGTGNDVVITLLSGQLPFTTDSISIDKAAALVTIRGTGEPDGNYAIEMSTDLKVWTKDNYIINANGALSYSIIWNPSEPKRFYRFIKP